MALVCTTDHDARYEDGQVATNAKFVVVERGETDLTQEAATYVDAKGVQPQNGHHVTPRGRVYVRSYPGTRLDVVWTTKVGAAFVEHSRYAIEPDDCHLTGHWTYLQPTQDGWTVEPTAPVKWAFTPEGLVVLAGRLRMPTEPTDYVAANGMFTIPDALVPFAMRFPVYAGVANFDLLRLTGAGSIIIGGVGGAGTPVPGNSVFLNAIWSTLS